METFQDPKRFSCFLVTNPTNSISVDTAVRYWGCATQAGIHVAGAFYPFLSPDGTPPDADFGKKFVPLSVASLPYVSFASPPNWDEAVGMLSKEAKGIMSGTSQAGSIPAPVTFNQAVRTVTLFLPGFQKSDIKLSQVLTCHGSSIHLSVLWCTNMLCTSYKGDLYSFLCLILVHHT